MSKTKKTPSKESTWKTQALSDALKEAAKGEFISHEAMLTWVDRLGTSKKVASPKPDVFSSRR